MRRKLVADGFAVIERMGRTVLAGSTPYRMEWVLWSWRRKVLDFANNNKEPNRDGHTRRRRWLERPGNSTGAILWMIAVARHQGAGP